MAHLFKIRRTTHPLKIRKTIRKTIRKDNRAIALALLLVSVSLPVYAHKTDVFGSIAATWHIEPNDRPQAGEAAQVWVALTRPGGEIIPLEQCDCQLKIWTAPAGTTPLLEPSLTPVSAEQYQGIPGAEVVFPQLGQYELRLSGRPRAGVDFPPFQFTHTVLVAAGTPAPPTPSPQATVSPTPATQTPIDRTTENSPSASQPKPIAQRLPVIAVIGLAIGLAVGVLGLVRRQLKSDSAD